MAEATEQLLLTLVGERVNLAGLAPGALAFVDPTSFYKSLQEPIDEIVVDLALA
jgi:hypothetical protein